MPVYVKIRCFYNRCVPPVNQEKAQWHATMAPTTHNYTGDQHPIFSEQKAS